MTAEEPTIEATIEFVEHLFAGVTDKGGKPYAQHCIRVMELLPSDATDDERRAALLHDVIADTATTSDDLRAMGYSERTVWLVESLSRPPASAGPRPSYMDWIRSIAATGDVGLIRIKLADNLDNSSPERIASLPEDMRDIVRRYERAMKILSASLFEGAANGR